MTALALRPASAANTDDGLVRSARLMRALGPEAAGIWAELSPQEARTLTDAMDALDDTIDGESEAARNFVDALKRPRPVSKATGSVWARLSAVDTGTLAGLLTSEHPQTLAVILSRMEGDASARLLRALQPATAIDAMHRLLHIGPLHPGACASLEAHLSDRIDALAGLGGRGGHERVARIFDSLDSRSEKAFLAALDHAEPGAAEKVRALMFTFDDLARLDPAGLQTLLSSADRSVLITALKGARPQTAAAFFGNMTRRAGELLRDEITAQGATRRSEVEAARQELVALARSLIQRGDIRPGSNTADEDLVE
ncbi:FliG C-terminal domain-containing protein [Hyphomonas johnsonii]|uniref:FliG C-terminal domain-containing protein n=1 Tax=Hyphomonas johnsonii TaxID=81031 RepID=UPI00138E28A9|nr:FliG C-terminal domain-containing protein [Hyphomonas johnsonii]